MKEMHILELSKLPPEEKNETSLLQWMRFLGGKTRKDFEKMAKKNFELEEAYDVLDFWIFKKIAKFCSKVWKF